MTLGQTHTARDYKTCWLKWATREAAGWAAVGRRLVPRLPIVQQGDVSFPFEEEGLLGMLVVDAHLDLA